MNMDIVNSHFEACLLLYTLFSPVNIQPRQEMSQAPIWINKASTQKTYMEGIEPGRNFHHPQLLF